MNVYPLELFNEEESKEATQHQKTFQPLGPSILLERRYVFHNRLIQFAKEHHKVI